MSDLVENPEDRFYSDAVHMIDYVMFSIILGEKEGATKSLDSCQDLLTESKSENAQLLGRVHAAESQIEGLKKGKEEVINQP